MNPSENSGNYDLNYDIVVVGGGPAGMSAALEAYENGVRSILIIEREAALGGILKQCIHCGFGLELFGEELTGPEFALRLAAEVGKYGIDCRLSSTVLDIAPDRVITATSAEYGIFTVKAGAIILAMGCRERPRGALNTPGTRPAGIYTAGAAQRYVNIEGYLPGREVVILGSGDIGLIMARRMTLEGAKVKAVCEVMPYSGGLPRNIEQCLNDFNIPLLLNHTVVNVHGKDRLTGVTIAEVDNSPGGGRRPVPGTEQFIPCDTLLLSVGLIPENELTQCCGIEISPVTKGAVVDQNRETGIPGIWACGNVLHVHDLADFAAEEARIAGFAASVRVKGEGGDPGSERFSASLKTDGKVRYTVPQRITACEDVKVYFRVSDVYDSPQLTVRAAGDPDGILMKKKYLRLVPGTMQSIVLTREMLEKCPDECTLEFGLTV